MGIKLQPGDYVSTEGMTEEQYHAVCRAFMDAGAEKGEYPFLYHKLFNFFGWKEGYGIFRFDGKESVHYFKQERNLTIDQILGKEKDMDNKDMTLQEAYKIMQDNCGIEVGDTVKVLRKAGDEEMGWNNNWLSLMDVYIGGYYIVEGKSVLGSSRGLRLKGTRCAFPFFVLELVKKALKLPEPIRISSQHKAEFKEGGSIAVGCQTLDFDMIERIYLAAKEVKDNG